MSAGKPAHVLWRRRKHSELLGHLFCPGLLWFMCTHVSSLCLGARREDARGIDSHVLLHVGAGNKLNPRSSGSAGSHLSCWATSPAPPETVFNTNPKENQKQNSVSLCSPRCPRTHGPLASASQMPALQCYCQWSMEDISLWTFHTLLTAPSSGLLAVRIGDKWRLYEWNIAICPFSLLSHQNKF